jgi:hypothetical protein
MFELVLLYTFIYLFWKINEYLIMCNLIAHHAIFFNVL